HSRGNNLPRSELELRNAHHEWLQASGADHLVGPSICIIEWLGTAGHRLPQRTYVHPNLLGHGAWAGRRFVGAPARPIYRIAFFGRLEPLKGLALFCEAISELLERVSDDF